MFKAYYSLVLIRVIYGGLTLCGEFDLDLKAATENDHLTVAEIGGQRGQT